jgi:hypothetical protein
MDTAIPATIQRLWSGTNRTVKLVWYALVHPPHQRAKCLPFSALPGTSQYTSKSVSSCALAAVNAVRVVFDIERDFQGAWLLARLQRPDTIRACLAICKSWKRSGHLEVDDVHALPLFQATLSQAWHKVSGTTGRPFLRILRHVVASLPSSEV